MTTCYKHQVESVSCPRVQYFQERFLSIYPRLRKIVGKKTWDVMKTTPEAEEEKLLKGAVKPQGEFTLYSLVNKRSLDELSAWQKTMKGRSMQVLEFVTGGNLPTQSIKQSFEGHSKREQVERFDVKEEEPNMVAVVFVINLQSGADQWKEIVDASMGTLLTLFQEKFPEERKITILVEVNSPREALLKEIELYLASKLDEVASVNSEHFIIASPENVKEKICEQFERKVVQGFDKVFKYICNFPSEGPSKLAEEFEATREDILSKLTDRFEEMVDSRQTLFDLWMDESQGIDLAIVPEKIFRDIKSGMDKRTRNLFLQEISPAGGMKKMIIDAALESSVHLNKLLASCMEENLDEKLMSIITQQLHLDFLKQHFNVDRKIPPAELRDLFSRHVQKKNCSCNQTIYKREYRVFAASVLQILGINCLFDKIRLALVVVDNVLLEMHRLRFEVHGTLRQTVARAIYGPLYRHRLEEDIITGLKGISGVYGCGLIYGRLNVYLHMEEAEIMSNTAEKVSEVLKQKFPGEYSIEVITEKPKYLVDNTYKSGDKIICGCKKGTLGCFVRDEQNQLLFLTSAHIVNADNFVYVESRTGRRIAGKPLWLDTSFDIAAVDGSSLENEMDSNFFYYDSDAPQGKTGKDLPGEVYDGEIDYGDRVDVFKNGTITGWRRGVLACPNFVTFCDGESQTQAKHILVAPNTDKPFAKKGDSGSVVCMVTPDASKVQLIAMVSGGPLAAATKAAIEQIYARMPQPVETSMEVDDVESEEEEEEEESLIIPPIESTSQYLPVEEEGAVGGPSIIVPSEEHRHAGGEDFSDDYVQHVEPRNQTRSKIVLSVKLKKAINSLAELSGKQFHLC